MSATRLDDPYALLSDDQRALMIGHLELAKKTYRALQHEAEDNLELYHAEAPIRQGAWEDGYAVAETLIGMIAEYRMMADELMDLRWEL